MMAGQAFSTMTSVRKRRGAIGSIFKALKTLCAQNRDLYGPQITEYWDVAEDCMAEAVPAILSDAKGSEDAAKILTGYSLKCQEASYNDAAVLYGDVLRNIMLNTDTLQYKFDYGTLEYKPNELTLFEISFDPGETRHKYGY